jgi:hypothetical protein
LRFSYAVGVVGEHPEFAARKERKMEMKIFSFAVTCEKRKTVGFKKELYGSATVRFSAAGGHFVSSSNATEQIFLFVKNHPQTWVVCTHQGNFEWLIRVESD